MAESDDQKISQKIEEYAGLISKSLASKLVSTSSSLVTKNSKNLSLAASILSSKSQIFSNGRKNRTLVLMLTDGTTFPWFFLIQMQQNIPILFLVMKSLSLMPMNPAENFIFQQTGKLNLLLEKSYPHLKLPRHLFQVLSIIFSPLFLFLMEKSIFLMDFQNAPFLLLPKTLHWKKPAHLIHLPLWKNSNLFPIILSSLTILGFLFKNPLFLPSKLLISKLVKKIQLSYLLLQTKTLFLI